MAQKLIQTQAQKLQQLQRLSAQQMLQVKLLEMPLTELEDSINAELDDNPALESENPDDMLNENVANDDSPADDEYDNSNDEDAYEAESEKEARKDELDQALESIGKDDQMPDYNTDRYNNQDSADYEEMIYGDTTSFYDKLKEQMDMQPLSDKEKKVMEYLIGSLDDDGLLRKDLDSICDELAIYHNIDVTEKDIEHVLHILQTFDPAGVGGRSLQECLLLQVKRLPRGVLRKTMEEVFTDYFEEFTKKHWDKIKAGLELNDTQVETLQEEIRKLNPKPGASMGETEGRNMQQITPDFIIDTDDDGNVTFTLNGGNIPELKVSPSFTEMMETYRNNRSSMSKRFSSSFFAIFSASFWLMVFSAFSISVSISPMPRMREAILWGWNCSNSSSFSPMPTYLMGLPVTASTDSAAPPRVSESSLDISTLSMPSASSNAFATLTAS